MRLSFIQVSLRRSPSVPKNLDKFANDSAEFIEAKKIYFKTKNSLKNDTFEKNIKTKSCECYFKY